MAAEASAVAGPCPAMPGDPGTDWGPPARVNTRSTTADPATHRRSRRDLTTAPRPRPVRPAFMVSPMLTSRKPAVNHDGTPAMDEVRSDRSTPYSCATGAGLARVAPRSTRDLAPSTVEICAEVPRIGDWATTPHASNAHETANLGHPPDVARCLLLRRPSCYSANPTAAHRERGGGPRRAPAVRRPPRASRAAARPRPRRSRAVTGARPTQFPSRPAWPPSPRDTA